MTLTIPADFNQQLIKAAQFVRSISFQAMPEHFLSGVVLVVVVAGIFSIRANIAKG